MSDCMTFPDTAEEFIEQYKVVDTDHVYSNGVEFIPIFRMKQWFEHLPSAQSEIIRCKDCKHRDPEDKKCDCGHDIIWQLPRGDAWYCADAERRTDEAD